MQKTHAGLITFAVDEVTPAGALREECRCHEILSERLGGKVESCCDFHGMVVKGVYGHAFLEAVYTAFSEHRPLVLGPDMIWITILQGVAKHMLREAERLRKRFVRHEGKLALEVDVTRFMKGSPENPWEEAFAGWSHLIREHIGSELHEALVGGFSTTGPVERAVSEIILMDIFEKYFAYRAGGICGIPEITLEGTVGDWARLRAKIEKLEPFDLEWWVSHLRGICDEFVNAAKGRINLEHWRNICKLRAAYGGDIINGWIGKLFPYLGERNPIFETGEGFRLGEAGTGLSRVPFVWTVPTLEEPRRYDMEAIGGFTGIEQNRETKALRPKIGWAVKEVVSEEVVLNRLEREHVAGTRPGVNVNSDEMWETLGAKGFTSSSRHLPNDMGRFYFRTNGVEMFGKGEAARFRIATVERLQRLGDVVDEADYDAIVATERKWRGVAPAWCRFCELADGSFLAIDLEERSVVSREVRAKLAALELEWAGQRAAENARIVKEARQWGAAHTDVEERHIEQLKNRLTSESPVHSAYWAAYKACGGCDRHDVWLVFLCQPGMEGRELEMPVVAKSFGEFLSRALESNGKYWWEEAGYDEFGTVGEYCARR